MPVIPVSIEIIVRLYLEYPKAPGWEKYSLQELFDLMYGEQLAAFEGRPDYTAAKVDLGNRFTRLFDRSPSRKYNWLRDDDSLGDREFGGAYSDVETILTILKDVPNPKETLERVASHVFALRGVNIDAEHRIPTLAVPPTRRKTGRKAMPRRPTPQVTAKASKAAARAAKPEVKTKGAAVKKASKAAARAAKPKVKTKGAAVKKASKVVEGSAVATQAVDTVKEQVT